MFLINNPRLLKLRRQPLENLQMYVIQQNVMQEYTIRPKDPTNQPSCTLTPITILDHEADQSR